VPPALTLNKSTHEKGTLLKAYCFWCLIIKVKNRITMLIIFYTENIGKSGFCYFSDEKFAVDDWNKVQL